MQKRVWHMTKLFQETQEIQPSINIPFSLEETLKRNSWQPKMSLLDAELALEGKPAYTYLLRPSDIGRGFAIAFVQKNRHIKHDYFRLINPMYGIFINGWPSHVGQLEKVIRDMMHCEMHEGAPL
jgi:hypothetical protein